MLNSFKKKIPFHCQTELQTYRIFCWPRGNFYHYIGTEDVWGEKYLRKRTIELKYKRLQKSKKVSCDYWNIFTATKYFPSMKLISCDNRLLFIHAWQDRKLLDPVKQPSYWHKNICIYMHCLALKKNDNFLILVAKMNNFLNLSLMYSLYFCF